MNIKNIMFVTFTIVIFVVVPAFVIWPSVKTIRQTAESIYSEYEQLEAKHRRGHQMKFVAAEFRDLEPIVENLHDIALQDGDELEFITSLESMANANSVTQTLKLHTNNIEPSGRRFQKLPFELTLSGSYANIIKHIAELESLTTITQITDLRFTPIDKNDNETQARINAYVLQEK